MEFEYRTFWEDIYPYITKILEKHLTKQQIEKLDEIGSDYDADGALHNSEDYQGVPSGSTCQINIREVMSYLLDDLCDEDPENGGITKEIKDKIMDEIPAITIGSFDFSERLTSGTTICWGGCYISTDEGSFWIKELCYYKRHGPDDEEGEENDPEKHPQAFDNDPFITEDRMYEMIKKAFKEVI